MDVIKLPLVPGDHIRRRGTAQFPRESDRRCGRYPPVVQDGAIAGQHLEIDREQTRSRNISAESLAEPDSPPTRQDLSVRALETIRPGTANSNGAGDWVHLLEALGRGDANTIHQPAENKGSSMNVQTFTHRAPSIKLQTRSKRLRLRRGGWLCLSGADTSIASRAGWARWRSFCPRCTPCSRLRLVPA